MHFDAMKTMLEESRIEHVVDKDVEHSKTLLPDTDRTIEVHNSPLANSRPVLGYMGFVSFWCFNSEGKLIGVGHYE